MKQFATTLLALVMTMSLLSACADQTIAQSVDTAQTVVDTAQTLVDAAETIVEDLSTEPVTIQLNEVTHSVFYAPLYAAMELGYFEDEGLEVEIKHPTESQDIVTLLEAGETDFITSMAAVAMLQRDKGVDLINTMQLMSNSQLVFVSHEPLNGSLESLQGKKIATWKSDHSAIAIALLRKMGIEVEWIYHLAGANVFLADCVDAMLAMEYNELQTIIECGREIAPEQILSVRDIQNIPEDGVYTTKEFAKQNPETIEKFNRAASKGWMWVAQNRKEALDLVMKVITDHDRKTNIYHQRAMLNIILDNGVGRSQESFQMSETGFNNLKSILLEGGVIENGISYEEFVLILNK